MSDTYGTRTIWTMEQTKEDIDEITKTTIEAAKKFDWARNVILQSYYIASKNEETGESKDKNYDSKIIKLKELFDSVEFWDFFQEERQKDENKIKNLFKKLEYMAKTRIRNRKDSDYNIEKFGEVYEILNNIGNLSYTNDLEDIQNFYNDKYMEMETYQENIFLIKDLFKKFISRYHKEDFLRDYEEGIFSIFKQQKKLIERLKSSTDFESDKERLIDNITFLAKYIEKKLRLAKDIEKKLGLVIEKESGLNESENKKKEKDISGRTVRNWNNEIKKKQIQIRKKNLIRLAFILKLTREELNDALKKKGHRELYVLDNNMTDFLVYEALEYNRLHEKNPLSYEAVMELVKYGNDIIKDQKFDDDFAKILSIKHNIRKTTKELENIIKKLKDKIQLLKNELGIETEEENEVQQVITNMLMEKSTRIGINGIGDFDGTEEWVQKFIEKFQKLYQYQYMSQTITLCRLYKAISERMPHVFPQKSGSKKSTLEESDKKKLTNWENDIKERVDKLFETLEKKKDKLEDFNRKAAIEMAFWCYLADIDLEIINNVLEQLHFGPLNARVKEDAVLISLLHYIQMEKISDKYVVEFLKIIFGNNEKKNKEIYWNIFFQNGYV